MQYIAQWGWHPVGWSLCQSRSQYLGGTVPLAQASAQQTQYLCHYLAQRRSKPWLVSEDRSLFNGQHIAPYAGQNNNQHRPHFCFSCFIHTHTIQNDCKQALLSDWLRSDSHWDYSEASERPWPRLTVAAKSTRLYCTYLLSAWKTKYVHTNLQRWLDTQVGILT